MKILSYTDVDFDNLSEIIYGSKNDIYVDDFNFYKIYNGNISDYTFDRIHELGNLNKYKFLNKPTGIIMDDEYVIGSVQDKLIDYVSVNDLIKVKDTDYISYIIGEISKDLYKLHSDEKNVVVGDLHFNNILVSRNNDIKFIDVDSYGINKIDPEDLPTITYNYYTFMNYYLNKNKDMDKISLYLSIFDLFFEKEIHKICEEEYDIKAEKIAFLKKIKDIYFDLKNSYYKEPDLPYVHQLI